MDDTSCHSLSPKELRCSKYGLSNFYFLSIFGGQLKTNYSKAKMGGMTGNCDAMGGHLF